MSITDLIENYSGPDTSQDVLKEFATELLELIKEKAPVAISTDAFGNSTGHSDLGHSIAKALEELRK